MISAVPNTARSHNLPSSCYSFFSSVPNRFKYRQNAPLSVLVFNFSLKLQIVSKPSESTIFVLVFNFFSLKFHIVSDAVRMQHLMSLLSKLSLQFQIVSECTLYCHFFFFSLKFQIVSNSVRMHACFCFVFSEVTNRSKYCKNTRSILFSTCL